MCVFLIILFGAFAVFVVGLVVYVVKYSILGE